MPIITKSRFTYTTILFVLLVLPFMQCSKPIETPQYIELKQKIEKTPLSQITIPIQESLKLTPAQSVSLLLIASQKEINETKDLDIKDQILTYAYRKATDKEKKEVLFRMIDFYYEEMFCFANTPNIDNYALLEGFKRCHELQNKYKLTPQEKEKVLNKEAEYLIGMKLYKASLLIELQLLSQYQKEKDIEKIIIKNKDIATLYQHLNDHIQSKKYNTEAYILSKNDSNTYRQLSILTSLSINNTQLGNYTEAIENLKTALSISPEKDPIGIHYLIADNYLAGNDPKNARKELYITLKTDRLAYKHETYQRLASSFIKEEHLDSARYYMQKTQTAFNTYTKSNTSSPQYTLPIPYNGISIYISYARLLEKKGASIDALSVFELIRPMLNNKYAPYNTSETAEFLDSFASLYREKGKYDKAINALILRDSILTQYHNTQKTATYEQLTNQYTNRQIYDNIQWREQKFRNTQRIYVLLFVLVFLLMISLLILYFMNQSSKLKIKNITSKNNQTGNYNHTTNQIENNQKKYISTDKLYENIEKHIIENELFKNPNITIDDIAQEMQMRRTQISNLINNKSHKNFNQWINDYRINYILSKLTIDSNLKWLYQEAGFSSSATFYRCFKQYTAITPTQYIEKIKLKQP